MMTLYELTFLFDKAKKTFPTTLKKYLTIVKAKKVKETDWGVKPLAYPIKKYTEARYVHITAEIEAKKMLDLEKKLKLDEDLLRYLIVKVEAKNFKLKTQKSKLQPKTKN